jgi:hypothetical protein
MDSTGLSFRLILSLAKKAGSSSFFASSSTHFLAWCIFYTPVGVYLASNGYASAFDVTRSLIT